MTPGSIRAVRAAQAGSWTLIGVARTAEVVRYRPRSGKAMAPPMDGTCAKWLPPHTP